MKGRVGLVRRITTLLPTISNQPSKKTNPQPGNETGFDVLCHQGQVEELEALLRDEGVKEKCLNARIRPFGATPLRLAATGVSRMDFVLHLTSSDLSLTSSDNDLPITNPSAVRGLSSRTDRMRRACISTKISVRIVDSIYSCFTLKF